MERLTCTLYMNELFNSFIHSYNVTSLHFIGRPAASFVSVGRKYVLPRFTGSKCFLSTLSGLMNFVQARNPHAVQPYLHRCFDAIEKLEFGRPSVGEQEGSKGLQGDRGDGIEEDATVDVSGTSRSLDNLTSDIIAMVSPEGEKVCLRKVGTT